VNNLLGNDS